MEDEIKQAVDQFVGRLAVLSDEPYLREGVMKMAVREAVWAVLHEFGDPQTLADQLEVMVDAVREHKSGA